MQGENNKTIWFKNDNTQVNPEIIAKLSKSWVSLGILLIKIREIRLEKLSHG